MKKRGSLPKGYTFQYIVEGKVIAELEAESKEVAWGKIRWEYPEVKLEEVIQTTFIPKELQGESVYGK